MADSFIEATINVPVLDAERQLVQDAIVAWREKRKVRLEAKRVTDKLEKEEKALAGWLLEVFKQQELEGMIIQGRQTGLSEKEVPMVEDKNAFMEHIKKTGALELLQFRIAVGAIDEHFDNGDEIPGIGYAKVHDLFDRKS